MPEQEQATNRNFSIYPEQQAILERVARENGSGLSAALRYIIMEWERQKRSSPAPQTVEQPA